MLEHSRATRERLGFDSIHAQTRLSLLRARAGDFCEYRTVQKFYERTEFVKVKRARFRDEEDRVPFNRVKDSRVAKDSNSFEAIDSFTVVESISALFEAFRFTSKVSKWKIFFVRTYYGIARRGGTNAIFVARFERTPNR